MNFYDKGQTVRIYGYFTAGDMLTDPETVTLQVQTPGGIETTYSYAEGLVNRAAAGKYYRDVRLDEAGFWFYRWTGKGAAPAAKEAVLAVRPSQF